MKRYSGKPNIHGNKGLTLVELIVSMTLTALLATAVVSVMAPASRVYTQVKDLSRAQVVADMVVDALREECADTYIEDFASAGIVNTDATDSGDGNMLLWLKDSPLPSENSGNVLIIRKSGGYCEAIYSDLSISAQDYVEIERIDTAHRADEITSKAVYRLFSDAGPSEETLQGYVHYGYYQCGRTIHDVTTHEGNKTVSCIFPAKRYDYTVPFSISAYNGYTVDLTFSDMEYALAPGEIYVNDYTSRPYCVSVTVKVYKNGYTEREADENPVYIRTAVLLFAEDTTK
ncbi:MAG: type II secretion system GspH family protein [Lachnospiraceae bacterium]|nr:type II secretion system GspH family protein [Lachnospiraceae bacterium]